MTRDSLRHGLVRGFVLTLFAGLLVAAAGASGAPAVASAGATRYAVEQPLCAVPANPAAMRCFGIRRVPAGRTTPGAFAYTESSNLSLGPAGGYTPDDLAAAYGFDPTLARSSQLVAVVNWYRDPTVLADLNVFDAQYGLPKESASSFRVVSQTGGSNSSIKADADSAGEQSLDVESVRGVCHSCRILLVEARTGTDADIAAAENEAARLGATEIDNSFGEPEPAHGLPADIVAAYHHPGVVITASTGDNGWYGWDGVLSRTGSAQNAPSFPSTSPDVVAVGGTELGLNNTGRAAEIVWNENGFEGASNGGATGGGCSTLFAAPAWQVHQPGYAAAGCRGKRLAADVSAIADPQLGFDVYNTYGSTGWSTIGGTSLSAPVTAAMFALAGGAGGAAYPAASVYANANAYPQSVFDITSVSPYTNGNGYCGGESTSYCGANTETSYHTDNPNAIGAGNIDCSFPRDATDPAVPPPLSRECNAVSGYDGPTGVGTPKSLRLYTHTNPSVAITRPTSARLRVAAVYSAKAVEPIAGTRVTSYVWSWGDGNSTTTTSAAPTHAFTRAGTYTIRVSVSDSSYQTSTASTTVTVGHSAAVTTSGPTSLHRAKAGAFSAHATTVNSGARISRVTWSWGDKLSTVATSAKHAWARTGTYTVKVTVLDSTGVSTTISRRVKIVA